MLSSILSRVMRDVERKLTKEVSNKATGAVSGLLNKSSKKEDVKESSNSDLLTACMYVAFAASYADGNLDKTEEAAIEEMKSKLEKDGNSDIAIKMMQIKGEKPSFGTAMKYVDSIEKEKLPIFDGIIDDTLKADGEVGTEEKEFLGMWESYKNNRK